MNTVTPGHQGLTLKTWLALIILALSTFTIVTTELAPIGLLTPMAEGLGQPESMIGLTVTLYAGSALSVRCYRHYFSVICQKNRCCYS